MNDAILKARIPRQPLLQRILTGMSDGVLLLEPDGAIAWANHLALDMHGARSIQQLGGTAVGYCRKFRLKYRNGRILSARQYPIRRSAAKEEFADVTVEVLRKDDADFHAVLQVRSLALRSDTGTFEAAILIMKDLTSRYNAEARFERTFQANPAPALICRLADLRYVKVNHGFLDMTGYRLKDIIGCSTYELDILHEAEKKRQAIANLEAGRTIPQMQAMLKLPDGSCKSVIVAGQPIQMGDDECMLFTFIDLDPRKRVEDELRRTQERFSKAFQLAPVPMVVATLPDFRLVEVNDAFSTVTGHSAQDALGREAQELGIWADPQQYRALHAQLERHGSARCHDIQLCTRTGELIDCQASAETVDIQGQCHILGVFQDVTERRRSEAELLHAIEAVMQDTTWFSRSVIEKLAQLRLPRRQAEGHLADLTRRERDVLSLMCEGLDDADIGRSLKLSRHTVRNHVASIYSKIGVHRRSAAVVWARERGIVGAEKSARNPGG